MVTCPVCEHQQPSGGECENCGKQLSTPRAAEVPVQRLPELEQTQIVDPRLRVSPEVMPDLEATTLRSGPDLPAQAVPELERTHLPAVANVVAEQVADLDLGRVQDTEPRTAAPTGVLTCRYCRHEQAEGLLCDRCGMRLPRAAVAPAAATAPRFEDQDEWTRCKDCGSKAKIGHRCANCGHMVQGTPAA